MQDEVAQVQRSQAKAEAARDMAQHRLDEAALRLREEFGVSSAEEAKARLARLESELASRVEVAERALAEVRREA